MELDKKIRGIAEGLISPDVFVVDVILSKHRPMKIAVLLDGDSGVTIDDCSKLSRQLAEELDKEESALENYILEVGTPGLDHPLKLIRQYKKNIGRELKVQLKDKSQCQGKLTASGEDKITLETEVKEGKKTQVKTIEVPYSEIEKAFVMVSFKK